jgi:hypothetical protein
LEEKIEVPIICQKSGLERQKMPEKFFNNFEAVEWDGKEKIYFEGLSQRARKVSRILSVNVRPIRWVLVRNSGLWGLCFRTLAKRAETRPAMRPRKIYFLDFEFIAADFTDLNRLTQF